MTKESVVFTTKGLIDITAITTFGVNVKEDPSAIGYFGTGFKYAVAVILRNGGSIELWRGKNKYKFFTEPEEIRGKQFDIVKLSTPDDNWQLGYTSDLGKNWEPWMALRELYCNTMDEAGETHFGYPSPQEGMTVIAVNGWDKFTQAYKERKQFFLDPNSSPMYQTRKIEAYPGHTNYVFYRGIRCLDLRPVPSILTYNVTDSKVLTEDRTFKNNWEILNVDIPELIVTLEDEAVIEQFCTAPDEFLESRLDFDFSGRPSPRFIEILGKIFQKRCADVRPNWVKLHRRWLPTPKPVPVELNSLDKQRLTRATAFCHKLGYSVDEYPITVVDTLGENVLALADVKAEEIFLTKQVFAQGTKIVAQALTEEWMHIKFGLHDESRKMQTFLFEQIMTLGEQLTGDML